MSLINDDSPSPARRSTTLAALLKKNAADDPLAPAPTMAILFPFWPRSSSASTSIIYSEDPVCSLGEIERCEVKEGVK